MNMKIRKNWLPLLSVLVLSSTMLAACGNQSNAGGQESDGPDRSATNSSGSGKPVELELIEPGQQMPPADQDLIKQALDKALNINFTLSGYPNGDDYKNQLNVRMASGNFPDLMTLDKNQLKEFASQGLLLDLTPYKDKLKQTIDYIGGDTSLKKGTVDGKWYAIFKPPYAAQESYWVRQDWLDKLKLKSPTTLDELTTVLKAFTEADPDGNGKKDTYGLTGQQLNAFNPIFGAFGVGNPASEDLYVKDGKVVSALYDPKVKDALAYIKSLIDAGVVDPELLTNTSNPIYVEKAIKGQVGMGWFGWSLLIKDEPLQQIKTVNPNANWVQIDPPKGEGGQSDSAFDIGASSGILAIPKSLEKDPEKLQKIFDLLNYVSGDGARLVQFGIEGRNYTVENGKVAVTDKIGEVSYAYMYQITGRPEMEYLSTKFPKQSEAIQFAVKLPRMEKLNGFVDAPDGYNPTDANRFIQQELARFLYGKRPLSEYDEFLSTLSKSMNYDAYLDAATKQLNGLGYGSNE